MTGCRYLSLVLVVLVLSLPSYDISSTYADKLEKTVQVEDGPEGVAVNPSTNKIYVSNFHSDSVSVIDGATDTIIGGVEVGDGPKAVGVNPSTNKIYLVHLYDDTLFLIDGATEEVEIGLKVGSATLGIGVNPSTNKIYVSHINDDTVSVIDGATDTIIGTLKVGDGPRSIGVNPSTNKIYVANNFVDSVSVIDGSADTVINTAKVGNSPFDIGVNPSTNKIYVSHFMDDTVSVIDGATDTIIGTLKVEDKPVGIGVNPSTNKIYVCNRSGDTISVIDGSTDVFLTEGPAKKLDISFGTKHKERVSLIAVRNNGDDEIFSIQLKINEGKIRFVKVIEWERDRIDQSTVMVQTGDRPIKPGESVTVIMIVDNPASFVEWKAIDENSATLSSGTLNPFIRAKSMEGSIEISARVSESSDDAEEAISTGDMSLKSSDLELVDDGAKPQLVGMRFHNLQIPQGSIIVSAHIYFKVDQVNRGQTDLTFYGEYTDDATEFTVTSNDISTRTKTTASVDWNNVPSWDNIHAIVSTPDLSTIIQQIVDRPGWSAGNSMVIMVTGSGERTAESYNGDPDGAPLLVVNYTTEGSIEISARVSESSDDAEEAISTGDMSLKSSDLELVDDGGKPQLVGMRFHNLQIPQGSIIHSARIFFEVAEVDTVQTDLTFYGEYTDDAPEFTYTSNDISTRTKTTASVDWNNVPSWDNIHAIVSTPDLSTIIQQIVDRPGWSAGNSMVIMVTGSGERTAESYNGDQAGAPLLAVNYTP